MPERKKWQINGGQCFRGDKFIGERNFWTLCEAKVRNVENKVAGRNMEWLWMMENDKWAMIEVPQHREDSAQDSQKKNWWIHRTYILDIVSSYWLVVRIYRPLSYDYDIQSFLICTILQKYKEGKYLQNMTENVLHLAFQKLGPSPGGIATVYCMDK